MDLLILWPRSKFSEGPAGCLGHAAVQQGKRKKVATKAMIQRPFPLLAMIKPLNVPTNCILSLKLFLDKLLVEDLLFRR